MRFHAFSCVFLANGRFFIIFAPENRKMHILSLKTHKQWKQIVLLSEPNSLCFIFQKSSPAVLGKNYVNGFATTHNFTASTRRAAAHLLPPRSVLFSRSWESLMGRMAVLADGRWQLAQIDFEKGQTKIYYYIYIYIYIIIYNIIIQFSLLPYNLQKPNCHLPELPSARHKGCDVHCGLPFRQRKTKILFFSWKFQLYFLSLQRHLEVCVESYAADGWQTSRKAKSFVPIENLENSLYEGASLKAVLPVVYIYLCLFFRDSSHICQQVWAVISFLFIQVFQNLLSEDDREGSHLRNYF